MIRSRHFQNLIAAGIIMALLLMPATGCSKKSPSAKPQSSSSSEQKPQAPSQAADILKSLDSITDDLSKAMKERRMPPVEQKAEAGQGGAQQQSASGQSGGESQGSGGSGQGQDKQSGSASGQGQGQSSSGQEQKPATPPGTVDWNKENQNLIKIHESWNALEPEAVKAGLPVRLRDAFEKSLNTLSDHISARNTGDSLMAAIDLYRQFASLDQIFTLPLPGQFMQVRYHTLAAVAEAGNLGWGAAAQQMADVSEPWAMFKARAGKIDKKLLDKTEFSLQDLKQSADNRQNNLVIIKGEMALKNLKAVEQELSGSSGSSDSSSNSSRSSDSSGTSGM